MKLRIASLSFSLYFVLDSICISLHLVLITLHVALTPSQSSQVHPNPILYSWYRRFTVQISHFGFPVCQS
jgi:hypothetical protein